jgi:hypothetical protein
MGVYFMADDPAATTEQKPAMQVTGKQMPTLVKVIAVLYYIAAVFTLIGAIVMFVGGTLLAGIIGSMIPFVGAATGALLIVLGIVFVIVAVIDFFIGRGLWKGQRWARILAVIFAVLGFLGALSAIIQGQWGSIISLIINGAIAGYLWFAPEAKQAFA